MDYFIAITWNCLGEKLDDEDLKKLQSYLFENINIFKNFSNYYDFISEFKRSNIKMEIVIINFATQHIMLKNSIYKFKIAS